MKFGSMFRRENIEYWSSLAEIAAALGVIASVIYLGVQISGSTKALKSQTHYNALELAQRSIEMLIADQELAEIVEIGELNPDALNAAQFKRFGYYQVMAFNGWEYIYLLREQRAIPIELADAADSYYVGLIKTKPGLKKFWSEYKFAWVDPFLTYVEETFEGHSAQAGESPEIQSDGPGN